MEDLEKIKLMAKLKIAINALKAIKEFDDSDSEFSDAGEIAIDALRKIEMTDGF